MNTSTKYVGKLISFKISEFFLKFLLWKCLHKAHDLIEKLQPYGCVLRLCANNVASWVEREKKTSVSRGDRHELSVCLIHPQSDAHRTKVWK